MAVFDEGQAASLDFVEEVETAELNSSNSNRVVYAVAANGSPFSTPDPPNSCRYGGVEPAGTALTQLGSNASFGSSNVNLWRLIAPGTAGTLYQTGGGSTVSTSIAGAIVSDVDQTTPNEAVQTNTGSSTGVSNVTGTITVTGLDSGQEVLLIFVFTATSFNLTTFGTATNCTILDDALDGDFPYQSIAVASATSGGTSLTASLVMNSSSSDMQWYVFAIPLTDAAASGNTGTLARTNANDTLAASGLSTVVGSLARTNNNDTSAASGNPVVTGTLSRTNANDTLSSAGSVTLQGSASTTNANDTCAASGIVGGGNTGSAAATNNNDTLAATGLSVVIGSLARSNNNDTLVSSGFATVFGSLASTNNNDTLAAFGTSGTPPAPGPGVWRWLGILLGSLGL